MAVLVSRLLKLPNGHNITFDTAPSAAIDNVKQELHDRESPPTNVTSYC